MVQRLGGSSEMSKYLQQRLPLVAIDEHELSQPYIPLKTLCLPADLHPHHLQVKIRRPRSVTREDEETLMQGPGPTSQNDRKYIQKNKTKIQICQLYVIKASHLPCFRKRKARSKGETPQLFDSCPWYSTVPVTKTNGCNLLCGNLK
jgi:hypothetical protein